MLKTILANKDFRLTNYPNRIFADLYILDEYDITKT